MTHTIQTNKTLLLVEVPEDAREFKINPPFLDWVDVVQCHYGLPEGSWQFLAVSDSITEEQAADIVLQSITRLHYKYYDYEYKIDCMKYAVNSFRSLLRSHSITARCAVLVKI